MKELHGEVGELSKVAKPQITGVLKSRWYPINVRTMNVYIGKYHGDQRYGFPRNIDVFKEWKGTNVTGIKGSDVIRLKGQGKVKLTARSLYRK